MTPQRTQRALEFGPGGGVRYVAEASRLFRSDLQGRKLVVRMGSLEGAQVCAGPLRQLWEGGCPGPKSPIPSTKLGFLIELGHKLLGGPVSGKFYFPASQGCELLAYCLGKGRRENPKWGFGQHKQSPSRPLGGVMASDPGIWHPWPGWGLGRGRCAHHAQSSSFPDLTLKRPRGLGGGEPPSPAAQPKRSRTSSINFFLPL